MNSPAPAETTAWIYDYGRQMLAANPDLRFFDGQRGYVRVEVEEHLWRNDFRVVRYVERPGAPIHTRASYVVEGARGVAFGGRIG